MQQKLRFMSKRLIINILAIVISLFVISCDTGQKQKQDAQVKEISGVSVNEENYAMAMADMAMNKEFQAGANNTNWHHHYNVMQLDKQPAPMMNKDTKYSFSIADGGGDVAITLPETDGRYMSLHVWNNDHITVRVYYGPGRYVIPASATSEYFVVNVRTQVDASDQEDVAQSSKYQDMLKLEYLNGYEPKPFKPTNWNMEDFKREHTKYVAIANEQGVGGTMGTIESPVSKQDVNRGISIATGLLPDADAAYLTANYHVDMGKSYTVTYEIPEMSNEDLGFFSITMYGSDQFLKTDQGSSISNREIKINRDGKTFDIQYVPKSAYGTGENQLIIPEEDFWINMRVYLPGESITSGEYQLPTFE